MGDSVSPHFCSNGLLFPVENTEKNRHSNFLHSNNSNFENVSYGTNLLYQNDHDDSISSLNCEENKELQVTSTTYAYSGIK